MSFMVNKPSKPTLIAPSGIVGTSKPTYRWNMASGATKYRLSVYSLTASGYVLTQNVLASTACSGSTCSFTQPTALPLGNYRFKVSAYNALGWGPVSSWMYFTFGPPGKPTLISPSGATTATTPKYRWNTVAGATKYKLSVYNIDTSTYVVNVNVNASTYCVGGTCGYKPSTVLNVGSNYRFKVRAYNPAGWGPISAWMKFNITCARANFPFSDGFETGTLRSMWSTYTTDEGRVQVSSSYKHGGTYSVLLDDTTDNATYSTAGLILTINLAGQTEVDLGFWWREFGDENDPEDGVFISDDFGSTWKKVLSFNGGPSSYRKDVIDLDAEAASSGISFTGCFQIKFQGYDNYSISTDGYSIDDVKVYNHMSAPSLVSPSGTITDTTPAYTWNQVTGANKYQLYVYSITGGTSVLNQIMSTSSACTGGTCSFTQPAALSTGNYRFRMRAYNMGGWGPFSTWKFFTISP
jgi:hypothetical protein